MDFSFDVQGLQAFDEMIDGVGTVLGGKAMRKGLRKALDPIRQEVIRRAPRDLGDDGVHIGDSIKIGVRKGNKRESSALVGMVKTVGAEVNYYAALVEFGRYEYVTERTELFGRPTRLYKIKIGESKPQPFMRDSLRDTAEMAVDIFKTELASELSSIVQNKSSIAKKKINPASKKAAP